MYQNSEITVRTKYGDVFTGINRRSDKDVTISPTLFYFRLDDRSWRVEAETETKVSIIMFCMYFVY